MYWAGGLKELGGPDRDSWVARVWLGEGGHDFGLKLTAATKCGVSGL